MRDGCVALAQESRTFGVGPESRLGRGYRFSCRTRCVAGGALVCLALLGCGATRNAADSGGRPGDGADRIARRLDSLAALSTDDYIHLQIGPCLGWCEASVSVFRGSPAKLYIYEAEAWRYSRAERGNILYRIRRPISLEQARHLIDGALHVGMPELVFAVADGVGPEIWLRSEVADVSIRIDARRVGGGLDTVTTNAGGASEPSLLGRIREVLLAPLFDEKWFPSH